MAFCPRCGKQDIEGTFCGTCQEALKELEGHEKVIVEVCHECGRIKEKHAWKRGDIVKHLQKEVRKAVKGKRSFEVLPPKVDTEKRQKKVTVEISDGEYVYDIPATIHYPLCPQCSKKGTEYFEGILQLRNPTEEVLDYLAEELRRAERKGAFVNKLAKAKEGQDYYMTSQKELQTIGNHLQKRFGGTLKINSQLFTRDKQTSKELYRVNVYFEPPPFQKGDIIIVDEEPMIVRSLGKTITGTMLGTGKSKSFPYDSSEEYPLLKKQKTQVMKTHPQAEVMDPETYQAVEVENPRELEQDQDVTIVEHQGRFYLI